MMDAIHCPGKYCGRTLFENGTWSDCGACPRGFRTDGTHCVQCFDSPEFYDWLYLIFMALVALLLHLFFIDFTAAKGKFSKEVLTLHASAIIEVVGAAVSTLVLTEPSGEFTIRSCKAQQLSDWYTLLHNPNPGYEVTLHCTQEAVYPLYTMVFIFYALAATAMITIRPWLTSHFNAGKMTIYAGLYFYPILSLLHAVFGGIIYYTYPYLVMVVSLVSSAAHMACKSDQTIRGLIVSCVTDIRSAVILAAHWMLHAYGVIALTELRQPSFHLTLLALVPLPTAFYIFTARFTDPNKQHFD